MTRPAPVQGVALADAAPVLLLKKFQRLNGGIYFSRFLYYFLIVALFLFILCFFFFKDVTMLLEACKLIIVLVISSGSPIH